MDTVTETTTNTARYAKCIEASKRIRWDIDKDVIRGRTFDFSEKFLPDTISRINRLDFLNEKEKILLSQIQGRTYTHMFGLVERFICAKILDVSRDHFLGDQVALESLIRFSDEELKHQELFRRIENMIASQMPAGYQFVPEPNEFALKVLNKSTWAVLAMICHIELFTQSHYKESIAPDENVSALFKDVFLYHWREESQHAIMDELEWLREDEKLTESERNHAVDDLIELVTAIDEVVLAQTNDDVNYFLNITERNFDADEIKDIKETVLTAYRWQYIVSGIEHPRFSKILGDMITQTQSDRIQSELASILQ